MVDTIRLQPAGCWNTVAEPITSHPIDSTSTLTVFISRQLRSSSLFLGALLEDMLEEDGTRLDQDTFQTKEVTPSP
jgi:hypothetical protein